MYSSPGQDSMYPLPVDRRVDTPENITFPRTTEFPPDVSDVNRNVDEPISQSHRKEKT